MKFFSFLILLFASTLVFSQNGKLTIHGRAENKGNPIPHVVIEVYKDNEVLHNSKIHHNGAFKLDLDLGSVYNIDFSLDGYVNKSIAVIARSDSAMALNGRFFIRLT